MSILHAFQRLIIFAGKTILYCGGLYSAFYKHECWAFDVASNKWSTRGRLTLARTVVGSTHPTRGLLMTGGTARTYTAEDIVESTTNGINFDKSSYTKMPVGLSGHCQVN